MLLLENVSSSIPKGTQLKNVGRIEEVAFHHSMTAEITRKHYYSKSIQDVGNVNYLQGHKDNTLEMSIKQELDGCGVINLAGCGSLYLLQKI